MMKTKRRAPAKQRNPIARELRLNAQYRGQAIRAGRGPGSYRRRPLGRDERGELQG